MGTKTATYLVSLSCLALTAGCGRTDESPETSDRLTVVVGILPQADFVRQVGGDRVSVEVLIGPGLSSHTFELAPRQMVALARAKLYFRSGLEFEESLIRKIAESFPDIRIVDLRAGIEMRSNDDSDFAGDPHEHHDHADTDHDSSSTSEDSHDDHHHAPGSPDPHVWMNPRLVQVQCKTIGAALAGADARQAHFYAANLERYHASLESLHLEISQMLSPYRGREIFVYHPALGYFADGYGLKQMAVESGGREPSAQRLAALSERARFEGVSALFAQPQYASANANVLARAMNAELVLIDTLPADYLVGLRDVATKIKTCLERGPRPTTPEAAEALTETPR